MTRRVPALLLVVALAGCDGEATPPEEGEGGAGGAIACTPALLVRTPDGDWVEADGAEAGFYAGWQGFVYLLVKLRGSDPRATEALVRVTTETDGGAWQPAHESRVAMAPEGEVALTPELMVFYTDRPHEELVGHASRLRATVEGPCAGALDATVTLVAAPEPPGAGAGGADGGGR